MPDDEKVLYGICKVHYAIKTVTNGVVSFAAPVPMEGAAGLSLAPQGEPIVVKADNVTYVKMPNNQGYDGDLSIYNLPKSFMTNVLKEIEDSNGVMVEKKGVEQVDFALLFEFLTETSVTKRSVLYNCTASRPEISGATVEDTADPQPLSVPLSASSLDGSDYVKASVTGDENDAVWEAWFDAVYMPSLAAVYAVAVTVTDGASPVAGATVVLGGRVAVTGTDGKATFPVPNGTYGIAVTATGYTGGTDSVTVSSAAASKTIALTEVA